MRSYIKRIKAKGDVCGNSIPRVSEMGGKTVVKMSVVYIVSVSSTALIPPSYEK